MNKTFDKLNPWLEKAYALNAALILFEWDNETEAPEQASELTAKAIEMLSNESVSYTHLDVYKRQI